MRPFLDASALIKRYAPEPGTSVMNELFDRVALEHMACSALGVIEVFSILVRQRNDGRITLPAFNQALIEFHAEMVHQSRVAIVAVPTSHLGPAMSLINAHNLNASDALILRSALDLDLAMAQTERLVLFASDKRLIRAASAEGLITFDSETGTLDRLRDLIAT